MEFDRDVSVLFRDVITKLDRHLEVCRNAGNRSFEVSEICVNVCSTSSTKWEKHLLGIIGFLKVGRKRLFVYDRHGQQWEMNPLCVLDFYVHESRQRMGCGRRLFDFMLKSENLQPQHFAIDRPSLKFSSFLAKHYGLRAEIPQVNNFVIFEGFFTNRPGSDFIKNRHNGQNRPADYISNEGSQSQRAMHNNYNIQHHYLRNKNRPPSGYRASQVAAGLPSSRHSPQHIQQEHGVLKELNLNPRSAHNLSTNHSSPMGRNSPKVGIICTVATSLHPTPRQMHPGQTTPSISPSARPAGPGARRQREREAPPRDYLNSFNMHHDYQGRGGHLKVPSDPRMGPSQPSANMDSVKNTTGFECGDGTYKGVSGIPVFACDRTSDRDSPYPGLPAIGERTKPVAAGPLDSTRSMNSVGGGYYTRPMFYTNGDASWTVMGVLRNQNQMSARYSGHSRLW
ncbi:hypothetical protein BaRGS_00037435 [Batillaria attramentaria]|uniref:Alpha-tubulin N-acetyltransferase n=1 Tax=Batillaria attramentaria TaxID=370345 RepID=A0ABD0J9F8_9CAEN